MTQEEGYSTKQNSHPMGWLFCLVCTYVNIRQLKTIHQSYIAMAKEQWLIDSAKTVLHELRDVGLLHR